MTTSRLSSLQHPRGPRGKIDRSIRQRVAALELVVGLFATAVVLSAGSAITALSLALSASISPALSTPLHEGSSR